MANSVRLINYTQPQGEFITFFTELDSDLKVGNKVFIVGGNYDNIKYTDINSIEYNPFNEYANGYTVIAVDTTVNSNAITLNIKFRLSQFNNAGIDTSVFNPLPVYKTEKELLKEPNQIREAYISKSYFKKGEFNGGIFDDGIFGEYNIKGTSSTSSIVQPNREYERQHFVNKLINEYVNLNMLDEVEKLTEYDYSELEIPVLNNNALFNNNFKNIQASWRNGVFLGGDYQWGKWESKFGNNKTGTIQTLNSLGSAVDLLDTSKFNIKEFNNNNNGYGYSIMNSGNVGRVYNGTHQIEVKASERIISIDYFPYPLWKSLEDNRFNTSIRLFSNDNNKVFDIDSISNTSGTNDIIIKDTQIYETLGSTSSTSFIIEQLLFDEVGSFELEIYIKDNKDLNRNIIETARIFNADIFSGVINKVYMQGGDFHGGEFRRGKLSSNYGRMHFNNGVFNGLKETSFAEDVRWNDGTWIDGNWKGDINVSIKKYQIIENRLLINIPKRYKHLLQIGNDIFISYFKKSIGNAYFPNFTDIPDNYQVNFRTFLLNDIIENDELDNESQVQLILDGRVDDIKDDVNLQYAKVSQSYFNKGYWNDGVWQSGLRRIKNSNVNNFNYYKSQGTNFLEFTIDIDESKRYNLGDIIDSSNLQSIREINIGIIDGVPSIDNISEDDRTTRFIEPFNKNLTILSILNNTTAGLTSIITRFDDLEDIESDITWDLQGTLIDIVEVLGSDNDVSLSKVNKNTQITNTVWNNGQFKSGAWDGGIWRDGVLSSELYFDNNNTDIQSAFQSGYWKEGIWNKGVLLSGIWESGIFNNGIVTNVFNNNNDNDEILWDNGDTVFIDGIINNVEWRRGLMLNSQFNGGKIINGGIENVDFNGGQYTNGLGVYSSINNSNRSGSLLDDGRFSNLSAPSMIYIDGNGWVQLDQNSFFQKDYNVIVQDLDKYINPLNNQIFNIIDRNKYGNKIRLDYSTSGDNPLYLLEEFDKLKPILAIDNIDGIAQISEHKYWIGDNNHKRILELNTLTNEVDVLGLIRGDISKDIYKFNNIKFIKCASLLETIGINSQEVLYTYIIDTDDNGNDIVKAISTNKQDIFIIPINLDNINGEKIIDISVAPYNNSLDAETIFILTNKNNIFYAFNNSNEFKTFSLNSFVNNSKNIITLRKPSSNNIDLFIYTDTINHLILDFNITSQEYQVRVSSPININKISPIIGSRVITSFDAKYTSNYISIWFVLDNLDIYLFNYKEAFISNDNTSVLLNGVELEYPLSKISLNYNSSNLNVVGLNGDDSLYLSTSELSKVSTGFGNINSVVKFLDRNLTNDNKYWYYDDDTARLIHVDESLNEKYNILIDVDTISLDAESVETVKITGGDSNNRIFTIQRDKNNDLYSIRKSEFGKSDESNDTTFNIINGGRIYDVVYNGKLWLIVNDSIVNDEVRIVAIDNQILTNNTLSTLPYYDTNQDYGTNSSNYIFDIIREDNNFLCLLYSNNGELREITFDNNNSVLSNNLIYTNLPAVSDITIRFEGIYKNTIKHYSAYLSTSNGIVKIFSEYKIDTLQFRWSEFGSDLFNPSLGVTDLNKSTNNTKIISKVGESFIVIDGEYITEDYILDYSVVSPSNDVFGLSNQRLVTIDSTSGSTLKNSLGDDIGIYNQKSRLGTDGSTPSSSDLLLNNPTSITYTTNFTGGGQDYIFFIDNTSDELEKVIRYLNLSTTSYNYSQTPIVELANYKDLSYDDINNTLYFLTNVGSNSIIGNINSSFIHTNISTTINSKIYKKFSYNDLGGTEVFIGLRDDNGIDVITTSGISSEIISSNPNYSDVSLLIQNGDYIIFAQSGDIIETFTFTGSDVTDGNDWTGPETIDITNVTSINEIKNGINELSVYKGSLNIINTLEVDPTNINEDTVKIKDFSFNSFNIGDTVFVYNEPNLISESKGIIKISVPNTPTLGISRNNQLDDISTGTFINMVNINDNIVYALFNEGVDDNHLYSYNFITNTVTEILINPLSYRDPLETSPILLNFSYNYVDISLFENELVTLFEIIDDTNTTSGHFDIASFNGASFSKIDFVYGKDNVTINEAFDAIDSNGDIDTTRYEDVTGFGGIRYLVKSEVKPKIDFKEDYMYIYFGEIGSADFLKINNQISTTPIQNNEFEDLIVDIVIPGFYESVETVSSVTIYPDPKTGTGSAIADIIVGNGLNTIRATFNNSSSFIISNDYKFEVKTTLNASQITGSYSYEIYDFRVYDNDGNNIIIREYVSNNPINTIENYNDFYQLENTSLGKWEIQDASTSSLLELKSPIQPSVNINLDVFKGILDNNLESIFLEELEELDNNYLLNNITKGYKVDYSSDTLSPYITSRVLLNTRIHEEVSFNNLGTTKTAHLVSSNWDNGLFLGSWDTPFYFDNKIITDYSVFINGIFEGDFYDGFFLGGTFRNNSKLQSNLIQGHFISDNENINFISGNLNSKTRYDILSARYENDKIILDVEGLTLNGDDYINTIIHDINIGSVVKIPELFKETQYEVKEILRGDIKVNGKDEITFVINKPNLPIITTDSEIVDFFKQELLVQSFENANYLFGYFNPIHIFIKDNDMYITVQSDFNKFNNDGTYIPSIKPIISINNFTKITNSNVYSKDGKYYNTFELVLLTPNSLSDGEKIKFVQTYYLRNNTQLMPEGTYKSSIIIPDYLQIFTNTFIKTNNQITATFNSVLENTYISNVIGDGFTDVSNITVDLGNSSNSQLFVHDIMVDNSFITTPSYRPNDWLNNNVFISGKTDRTWRSGIWLNLDKEGFSKGKSQFGDTNIINNFEGDNSKIIDIFFEGEDYLWIELENIIFNVDKHRYINLRGFTGNKAQIIGSTRSKAFRILEVDNNLIKIKNPFKEYQGINAKDYFNNFNKDYFNTQSQEMILKGLYGSNIKACFSDIRTFDNNNFISPLDVGLTYDNWFQYPSPSGNWYISNNQLIASPTIGGNNNILRQRYNFIKGVEYEITIKHSYVYTLLGGFSMTIQLDNGTSDKVDIVTYTDVDFFLNPNEVSFKFTPDKNHEEFAIKINIGYQNMIIDSIDIVSEVLDSIFNFEYAYASVSAFNGGDFYGNFNTIWNSGNFRDGNFLETGKWFGSDENYTYNGSTIVSSKKIDTKYEITVGLDIETFSIGDFIRIDYSSIFINGDLVNTYDSIYGTVISATSGSLLETGTVKGLVYESNDFIPTDVYNVNITKYRTDYNNDNYLIVDYNSNLDTNSTVNEQLTIFDNNVGTAGITNKVILLDGSSGVPTYDLLNTAMLDGTAGNQFSIDFWFNYSNSNDITPLFAFHNSKNGLKGIKSYILNDKVYIEYINESNISQTLNIFTSTPNIWEHYLLAFNNDLMSFSLNGGTLIDINIPITDKYDVCYIGRMLDVNVSGAVNTYSFEGMLDEFRVWNVDMTTYQNTAYFPTIKDYKFINSYLPELTAYYDFDGIVDTKNYFPEEEDYFILNGSNKYVLSEDGEDFAYSGENLFYEIEYFADKSPASNGEYKLLTIEEIRDISDGISTTVVKYYLEIILKENSIDEFKYDIILRERNTYTTDTVVNETNYVLDNEYNDTIFTTNYRFFEKTNLIISDNNIYINGSLLGNYNLINRNLFKYTTNTLVHLGKYEFANIVFSPVNETFGFVGFITSFNMWKNATSKDDYLIYRIISGENTELFNTTNYLNNNTSIGKSTSDELIIPSFNNDGSQIWEHYIYGSENNFSKSLQEANISIDELDTQFRYVGDNLDTALPLSTWLEGDDFIKINTDNTIFDTDISFINNNNYILTNDVYGHGKIPISGMDNFKLFNKKIDNNGTAFLHVSASGYLFFEEILEGIPKYSDRFPSFRYVDLEGSEQYNQTSTTDAIQFNTILDIREAALNNHSEFDNVSYADREDEFVIKFFGLSSDMVKSGSKYHYTNQINGTPAVNTVENANFSFIAIRIDKINSNILIYTRSLGNSTQQKYQGLRRSDSYWSHINDKNENRLSYYKIPSSVDSNPSDDILRPIYQGDDDFAIAYNSTNGFGTPIINNINNTEYSLYIPRFKTKDVDDSYIQYIVDNDYDNLFKDYGIEIFKEFKGKSDFDFNYVEDNSLVITQQYVNILSDVFEYDLFDPINFINPIYTKSEQYLKTKLENNVPRVSFFYNGVFNGSIWHNGVFVDGLATNNNLIWKYGIKHNGTFEGGSDLIDHAHWLGGFHITDTNNLSFVRNLVWYRGQFNGGSWEKGQWLAYDLDNRYEYTDGTFGTSGESIIIRNDDWSLFNSGEWYSRIDEDDSIIVSNLFKDGDYGTFEISNSNEWGLVYGTSGYIISKEDISINTDIPSLYGGGKYAIASTLNPSTNPINTPSFSNPELVFSSNTILVKRNTTYIVTAKLAFEYISFNSSGVKIDILSNNSILNIKDIGYKLSYTLDGFTSKNIGEWHIKDNSKSVYTRDDGYNTAGSNNARWVEITKEFNTLENDTINIAISNFHISGANSSDITFYIDNIEMVGEDLARVSEDPYKIENHDSVWHGGIWSSPNVVKGLDENEEPIFYDYSYQNETFNLYRVKNNAVLDLPKVNSIWLGGLWLRGIFDGGIFANGFWHSVKCDSSSSGLIYENRIGSTYDETYSIFKQGQMMNSVWEGGIVDDKGEKLDVIFGELTQSSEVIVNSNNSYDFTWNNDFEFKVSTANVYSPEVLGRKEFIGYHNDPTFDNTDINNYNIEVNRVRKQFNTDGVMAVYWKRGKFYNGLFQFSHFDSLDLNQNRQNIISEELDDNESIFKGLIYSSKWKNGLFYANATDDEYPLLNEEPNSLFYYSNWEKGYWKSVGLDTTSGSPLDTIDNINITNALFSRSLWSSGVFEGGIFDLSIWRSGVTEDTTMKYKTTQISLEVGDENNLGFYVANKPTEGTNFEFGTSGQVIPQIENDLMFLYEYENNNFRYAGNVDNLASIWVNGCMRGSIWHGGIWQRGMFTHRNFNNNDEFDFFGNVNDSKYQLGIWFRGIWMSGYFSHYNDKVISKGANLDNNAHLYNNSFSGETINNEGRRCLFFSINAEALSDPSNIIGMSDDNYINYTVDAVSEDSIHNYASFFSRRMLKNSITSVDIKSYWSQFNGMFVNGTIYSSINNTEFLVEEDKMVFSLFCSISDKYLDATNNNIDSNSVQGNNDSIFIKSIKTSSSTILTDITFNLATPMWNNGNNTWEYDNANTLYNFINNGVVLRNGEPSIENLNIWRHNIDESTAGGILFGDGTITSNLLEFLDSDDNYNRVSIAQGCGMKWNQDESEGEPKYDNNIGSDDINFNFQVIDFEGDDFNGTNFVT